MRMKQPIVRNASATTQARGGGEARQMSAILAQMAAVRGSGVAGDSFDAAWDVGAHPLFWVMATLLLLAL
jgi:hypothetical protein